MESEYEKSLKTAVCLYDDGENSSITTRGTLFDQVFLIGEYINKASETNGVPTGVILMEIARHTFAIEAWNEDE